ncbi:DNA-3-methyladenine glycosylase family protein [Deinococcus aquiradiocola]
MADLVARYGPLEPLRPSPDPFAALVRAVLGQQLSVRAASAIAARLEAALGVPDAGSAGVWPPDAAGRVLALSPDALRALGLSWAKVRTVRALAEAAVEGSVEFAHLAGLDDEAVIAALLPLPGIGRWTAEMFLMFSLARPDVFSHGDLGLRRGLEQFYPGADPLAVVAAWSPQRTLGARYLWLARD